MKRNAIQKVLFLLGILTVVMLASGCTTPLYTKTVIHQYDANGKLTGTTVSESISQHDSTGSFMKVNITQQEHLEK
jgi:hypothetical protein